MLIDYSSQNYKPKQHTDTHPKTHDKHEVNSHHCKNVKLLKMSQELKWKITFLAEYTHKGVQSQEPRTYVLFVSELDSECKIIKSKILMIKEIHSCLPASMDG